MVAHANMNVDEMVRRFYLSKRGKCLLREIRQPFTQDESLLSLPLVEERYRMSPLKGFALVLAREFTLTIRNPIFLVARLIQTTLLGAIIGTLFWQIDYETNFNMFLSLQFFTLLLLSFSSLPQLSIVHRNIRVFYKHRDAHFFSAIPWGISLSVVQIPQQIVETLVFCSFVYWFSGMAPSAGKYFTYMLVALSNTLAVGGIFRCVACFTPRLEIANAVTIIFLVLVITMSGFTILRNAIRDYVIWLYWISPMAYAMRSMAINEFSDSRWRDQTCADAVPDPSVCSSPTQSFGNYILESFSFYTDVVWIWIGVGYCLAFFVGSVCVAILGLTYYSGTGITAVIPESRKDGDTEEEEEKHSRGGGGDNEDGTTTTQLAQQHDVESGSSVQASTIPSTEEDDELPTQDGDEGVHDGDEEQYIASFTPVELTFRNIHYYVPKQGGEHGEELELLKGITAFTLPGTLTALMGSSGAGKSTLLDVIAGRKTVGRMEGEILLNGYPKEQRVMRRITGYVEQFDVNSAGLTVLESLIFSARLRLPKNTSQRALRAFVDEQMRAIELDAIANAVVGRPGISGLSVEQRKRLSIGIELVSSPAIIFMDEPTSGLDARAAQIVMNTVKKIGESGRSIICTIHQPSREIFSVFDALLLLKRGGETIFFGDLGPESINLTSHLSRISGIPYTTNQNPATYMLEVTSSPETATIDFAQAYIEAGLSDKVEKQIDALGEDRKATGQDDGPIHFEQEFASSELQQVATLTKKFTTIYWRNPAYNLVRIIVAIVLALILGAIFWDRGTLSSMPTTGDIQNVLGALFASIVFIGASQLLSTLPVVQLERLVFYRERATGMYRAIYYQFAAGVAELPYIVLIAFVYGSIIYWMVLFEGDPGKYFTFILINFLTLSVFVSFGQMAAYLTPDGPTAMVLSATAISTWTLFLGFVLPRPEMPWYWRWINYIDPLTYSLQAVVTDQLGDNLSPITTPAGRTMTVKDFLESAFDYYESFTYINVAILFGFVFFFRWIGVFSLLVFNHQKK